MTVRVFAVSLCLILTGCATIPDVTVSYYFPKAETIFTVTQTIGCTPKETDPKKPKKHRQIRSVMSVAATTTNSADVEWMDEDPNSHAKTPHMGHFRFKALNGTFVDGDATVTMTPDGRLSGINSTTGGQADAVVKSLITVAGVVVPVVATLAVGRPNPAEQIEIQKADDACEMIDKWSVITQAGTLDPTKEPGKTAPSLLTLTYSVAVNYDAPKGGSPKLVVDQNLSPAYEDAVYRGPQRAITLIPDAVSKPAYDALSGILQDRMVTTLEVASTESNLRYLDPPTSAGNENNTLEVSRVALVNLDVKGHVADLKKETQIWAGAIPVPTRQTVKIPIPTPAMAGKTAFGLALSDYGSITSVHYGSNSGAPDTSDALGAIATALKPKSTADRASDIQAQADLIAQQQRLITCQADRTQCK